MTIERITGPEDLESWNDWSARHPQASLWQSMAWKDYQRMLGRETRVYAAMEKEDMRAAALVVVDRTSFGLSAWDVPRGPLWTDTTAAAALLQTIHADARRDRCLNLYFSPPIAFPSAIRTTRSPRTEQPEATRIVDLTLSDDDLLGQMHQKGRYNIKVAQKNGVYIEESTDVDSYAALAKQTAVRDHYKAAPIHQYDAFLKGLQGSFLLLARAPGVNAPVAGLLGVIHGETGIYYYGASDYAHRALMAPYLLQWEAIRRCREAGCTRYDLLGVAPPGADADHPWKGITGFKEKFGGTVVTYPSERRLTFRPLLRGLLAMKRRMFG